MATDVDLYEATRDRTEKNKGESAPSLHEVDLPVSILMSIHELLQQQVHFTAANAPAKTKKPKVQHLPRPKTAKDLYERQKAKEAFAHFEDVLVYVPTAEYLDKASQASVIELPPDPKG